MDNIYLQIAGFIICVVIVLFSGSRLSKYGDMMADLLGWGKMFTGIILMASVTSMPELMIGISSMTIVDAPDLAVGDILGSCAFNILIISIMDLFYNSKKPIITEAQSGHILTAAFGIIMLSIVAISILKPNVFGNIAWIGGFSFLFLILYIVAIRSTFLYDKKQYNANEQEHSYHLTLRQVILRYAINALFVISAALALPIFGAPLAEASGLGQSFFGTLFIAATTSLPEIVVSIAAIRLGTINLAIGNVLGSNIFNIGILAFNDILYTKGPLFLFTNPDHIIPVIGTIIMTTIFILGIVYKSDKKWKLSLDTAFILLVYVLMMLLLFYNI